MTAKINQALESLFAVPSDRAAASTRSSSGLPSRTSSPLAATATGDGEGGSGGAGGGTTCSHITSR